MSQMNVISLSANVLRFIIIDTTHSAFMVQEQRLTGSAYQKAVCKLRRKFHVYSAPAPIEVTGTQAGTMVLIRKHLHVLDKLLYGVHDESAFWSVGIVSMKNMNIAIASV